MECAAVTCAGIFVDGDFVIVANFRGDRIAAEIDGAEARALPVDRCTPASGRFVSDEKRLMTGKPPARVLRGISGL